MKDAIESDKTSFLLHSQKQTEVPVRISFKVNESSTSQFMPAYVKSYVNRVGIKVVSTFPQNAAKNIPVVTAQVLLLDPETGEVCAMMNGTEVTRIRTGAISGAATDILARSDSRVAALFGTGGQARSQLEALLTVRKIEEVRIYDVMQERISNFISSEAATAERFGVKLKAAASPDEAIDEADVITTVTISKTPVFDGKRVKPGAHVNGVGSYTPDARELDFSLIDKARVFVDNKEAVFAEAGDFLIPIKEGLYSVDRVAGELGEVLDGKLDGRQSSDQITVMKTVGYAVLDVVAAWTIYNRAIELGIGSNIDL
jgi:ornithine cyclodeaminase